MSPTLNFNEIFSIASNASSIKDLEKLINCNSFLQKAIKDFEDKYPVVDLTITPIEIEELKRMNLLTETNFINLSIPQKFSSFERLLLAALWKNGHIKRIKPIADGIVDNNVGQSKYGLVFRQFGKSLANDEEPIIDQHVLRAFYQFYYQPNYKITKPFPTNRALNDSDEDLVREYVTWFKGIVSKINPEEKKEFKYKLDKILFAIGKSLKL